MHAIRQIKLDPAFIGQLGLQMPLHLGRNSWICVPGDKSVWVRLQKRLYHISIYRRFKGFVRDSLTMQFCMTYSLDIKCYSIYSPFVYMYLLIYYFIWSTHPLHGQTGQLWVSHFVMGMLKHRANERARTTVSKWGESLYVQSGILSFFKMLIFCSSQNFCINFDFLNILH